MRTFWFLGAAVLLGCSASSGSGAAPKVDAGAPLKISLPDAGRGGHDASASGKRDVEVSDASDSSASTTYPAPHPAMPQEQNAGGPVMTSPKFVIITFAGDTLAPDINDFAAKVAASSDYWSGTTAEYGVGPVASVLDISVDETPATSLQDSDVQAWLTSKLDGPDAGTLEGGAPWPQPDGNTLYMIYYPSTVAVSMGGGVSCNQFYGYHGDYAIKANSYVTYSVVARCPPFPDTSAIDSVTSIASHELVEAATDPRAQDNPAWSQPDSAHLAWAVPAGGELGDLCAGYGNVFYTPSDVPYLVQRTWSNKAAAAGHDPCQPGGAVPYFNAAAVLPDTITINDPTLGMYTSLGVKIPVGGTGTVELDLYSDGPTSGPWTVSASDLSSLFGGPAELDCSFGGQAMATGQNGDKLELTIKVVAAGSGNAEVLWLQSSLGQTQPVWLGVVGNTL